MYRTQLDDDLPFFGTAPEPTPSSIRRTQGNTLEDWGRLAAAVCVLLILAAIAWSQVHRESLPPIPPHSCRAGKVAVYHGDNKIHCDAIR